MEAQDPEKTVVVVISIQVIEGSDGEGYSEIFPSSDMELLPALPALKHTTTGKGKILATLFCLEQDKIFGDVLIPLPHYLDADLNKKI